MDNFELTINAEKLLPGVIIPQSLKVSVQGETAIIVRINGPRMVRIGEGGLEGVARQLLRIVEGAIPIIEQEKMTFHIDGDYIVLTTPGAGLPIKFNRAAFEELAVRLMTHYRDITNSLLNIESEYTPLDRIAFGRYVDNRFSQEVEEIDLL